MSTPNHSGQINSSSTSSFIAPSSSDSINSNNSNHNIPTTTATINNNNMNYSLCCIEGCNNEAPIRNFSSLKGHWQVKEGWVETPTRKLKVCTKHYNKGLALAAKRANATTQQQQQQQLNTTIITTHSSTTTTLTHDDTTHQSESSSSSQQQQQHLYASSINSSNSHSNINSSNIHKEQLRSTASTSIPITSLNQHPSSLKTSPKKNMPKRKREQQQQTTTAITKQSREESYSSSQTTTMSSSTITTATTSVAVKSRKAKVVQKSAQVDWDEFNSHRFIDVTIMFNLSNDPCIKFNRRFLQDTFQLQVSKRFHKEVLFVEDDASRYELSLDVSVQNSASTTANNKHEELTRSARQSDEAADSDSDDGNKAKSTIIGFRWAQVLSPTKLAIPTMKTCAIPLDDQYATVLDNNIRWEEIIWGHSSIEVRGKLYDNLRVQFFYQRTSPL